MNVLFKSLIVFSFLVFLASCASTGEVGGSGVSGTDVPGGVSGTPGSEPYAYQPGQVPRGGEFGGPGAATGAGRVIYFEFDSTEIRPEDRPVVEAHARYLLNNGGASIILEGHADERGTREYNIGLGERRADAVRRLMSAYGVSLNQVRVVSYGEERPAVAGHNETAYAQNRRVEIVYN